MKEQLLLLAVVLISFQPRVSWADENIQDRFDNSLKKAKSITNVEIDWLDTLSVQDPEVLKYMKAKTFERTVQYSYTASGQNYRAACTLISGTQTNLIKRFVSSFDGNSYSTYSDDQHYMTSRSRDITGEGDNAQSSMNPLVAPFMFLTTYSDRCKPCMLRFVDIVSASFANNLVLPPANKSDGVVRMSTPGLLWNNQPTTWRIDMNEAGDSFTPNTITFTVPGLHYETVNRLFNYTNVGAYEFPGKIEWITSSYPPTVPPTILSTGLVVLISARTLDNIADSTFRLDDETNAAKTVWNWDQHTFARTSPELAKAHAQNRTVKNTLLLILFITAVVPIVVVVAKRLTAKSG